MSKKPERRRSQLGGLSPVAPMSGRVETTQPAPERTAPAAAAPAAPKRTAAAASSKPGTRTKMGYYAAPEDSERIRAAFIAARNAGRPYRSLSDFQLEAILDKVMQLEAELNGGRPFEGAPAHSLSPGRPME
ncbi:ParB family protein [Microbacterium sp. ZOR0019]|uniref:ParB family protein n=1 Tax=Microbacterium sp. ZOR0019 TaxID=1339233 RepID=UPI0018CE19BD